MILVRVLHPVFAGEHPRCEMASMGKPLAPPGCACLLMLLHSPLHRYGRTQRGNAEMKDTATAGEE